MTVDSNQVLSVIFCPRISGGSHPVGHNAPYLSHSVAKPDDLESIFTLFG